MTRHPLDGNAIAADAHYGREEPETETCPECRGDCWVWEYGTSAGKPAQRKVECPTCAGSGNVPVEQEEPEAQERDE